jgi:hypothetical protein
MARYVRRSNSGNFAIFTAIRRASNLILIKVPDGLRNSSGKLCNIRRNPPRLIARQ